MCETVQENVRTLDLRKSTPIEFTVTFVKPIPADVLHQLEKKYDLEVRYTTIRYVDDGLRGTMFVRGTDVPLLNEVRDFVNSKLGGEYKGIVGIQGVVVANKVKFEELAQEPTVAIADIHGHFAKRAMIESKPSLSSERIDLHVDPLHWLLGI